VLAGVVGVGPLETTLPLGAAAVATDVNATAAASDSARNTIRFMPGDPRGDGVGLGRARQRGVRSQNVVLRDTAASAAWLVHPQWFRTTAPVV